MARAAISLHLLLGVLALVAVGCSKQSVEDRARQEAEKIQKGMVDYDAQALEQKAPKDVVEEVQRNLTTINEYQGEINGTIDSVTVNAIEAFQREAGLRDDGLITDTTRERLAKAAAKAAKSSAS